MYILLLRILTCRALIVSRYCVLQGYDFTSFGLKYKVPKYDIIIEKVYVWASSANLLKEPAS